MAEVSLPVLRAACPDCPAARRGCLMQWVGATKPDCSFVTCSVEARAELPLSWARDYAFGLVRRGVVMRQRIDARGRTTVVDIVGPGNLVRFDDPPVRESADYAATDLLVCLLPRDRRAGPTDPQTYEELLGLQDAAVRRAEKLAHARSAPTALARVAALLCTLCDELGDRPRQLLPGALQQRDLAQLIGMRHETLCRGLGTLERRGIVARHPDGLSVLDRARLEELA